MADPEPSVLGQSASAGSGTSASHGSEYYQQAAMLRRSQPDASGLQRIVSIPTDPAEVAVARALSAESAASGASSASVVAG